MSMNVTVAESEGLKRKLQVEVPLEEVQSVYEEVFLRLRSNVRVPGFRPGKFPRSLAEKRFQSAMAGEAMQTLVPKYLEEALTELKLKPATEPQFENLEVEKSKPFKFSVAFEIVPEFDLWAPSKFKLKQQKPKVTAQDIEARVEEMRTARAAVESKGEAPAEPGDVVLFDFAGTRDGVAFEGGSGENQRIEVGAGQYLPEFDAQFPGITAGERKEFDVTFPPDYAEASLQGQLVHFVVTAREVQRKVPPALDAEFFKLFGEQVTSLEELHAEIKEQLEQEHVRAAQQEYQTQLADQMREGYDFPVPEALVEQGLEELEHRLSHDDPEVLQDESKLAALKIAERARIEANLRVAYAVDALSKQYDVKTEQEEVRQRFYMQAYMMQQDPTELLQSPYGRRMMMQIEQALITGKTLERLSQDVLATGGKGEDTGKAKGGGTAEGKKGAATAAKAAAPKAAAAATPKAADKAERKAPSKGSAAKSGAAKGGSAKSGAEKPSKPAKPASKPAAKPKGGTAKGKAGAGD